MFERNWKCVFTISYAMKIKIKSGENNDDDDEPGQDVCMVYQIIPTTISTVADMFWFEIFI